MNTFIITAGGIGKRMGGELPKQFLLLGDRPILLWTLERFYEADNTAQLLITLPEDWIDYWNTILNQYKCSIPHKIVSGGIERYDSIKNALQEAKGSIIGVHDGVRPLVSVTTILNCIECAKKNGSAIPYLPVKESIRKIKPENYSTALNRSEYILVQTPQCFSSEHLRNAYKQPFHSIITDDASLVEEAGYNIHLVEGNEENIKITTPLDLKIAELLINKV
jgi:2-C-methyl-D-erythritol 4-phosphate cytidylyltransferase